MTISLDTQLLTLLGHAAVSPGLKDAVNKSAGARFYKCAFQLNPFGYLGRFCIYHFNFPSAVCYQQQDNLMWPTVK